MKKIPVFILIAALCVPSSSAWAAKKDDELLSFSDTDDVLNRDPLSSPEPAPSTSSKTMPLPPKKDKEPKPFSIVVNKNQNIPQTPSPAPSPAAAVISLPAPAAKSETMAAVLSPPPAAIREVRYMSWPINEGEKAEEVTIIQSTSQILRFDRPLTRIAVSDTSICDITTIGSQEVLVYCTKPGRINLMAWDARYQIAIYDIQSVVDIKKLQEMLMTIDPEAQLKIVPYGDSVSVYGSASTSEKVKKMEEAAKAFNIKAVSSIKVLHPKQILLEVRFAEIDRRASETFGLDSETISRFINTRSFAGEAHSGASETDASRVFTPKGSVRSVLPLVAPDPDSANEFFNYTSSRFNVSGYLKWLETKNILKLTAHPNLMALDGEQANFVVGGESPYITATQNAVNISFKEFGTKLGFIPTVLDDQKIRLKMNVEVSELDFSTTVTLQGTTVPTVVKNTHQTVAELGDNETLVVGGLVNQRINQVEKKVPILGNIPFISSLFRRKEYSRKDIELLIVVTPHIVVPFQNPVKKDLYPAGEVLDATAVSVPAYPDLQADQMNRLLVQSERYHDFDGFTVKRAKEVEEEFVRIKEREDRMNKTLQDFVGTHLQEKATPFSVPATHYNSSAVQTSTSPAAEPAK